MAVMCAAGLALAGCGRDIDLATTGAQPVPGARNLYYFCHGNIALYFSKWDSSPDEYEFIVYDSPFCLPPGQAPDRAGQPQGQVVPDGDGDR